MHVKVSVWPLPHVEQDINHVLSDGKGNMYECVHSEFNHTISKGLQVHWDTMFFFVQVAHACRCADIPVPNEVVSSQKNGGALVPKRNRLVRSAIAASTMEAHVLT